jgi:hypothetical protein
MNRRSFVPPTAAKPPAVAATVVLFGCTALSGCFFSDRTYSTGGYVPGPVMSIPACPTGTSTAASVAIDTGAALSSPPGEGTGVFVEYQTGGHWRVYASCDTVLTGQGCTYDVTAQVFGGAVSNLLAEGLEPSDLAGSACSDSAYLSVNTGSNFDGMLFDTPAGAPVRITATLGGAIYNDLIYWVGGGVARSDANSNPLDLTPTAP